MADLSNFARAYRRDGKVVIEIPETKIIESAKELLFGGAEVTDAQRLLDHVVSHLTSRQHTCSGQPESVLHQWLGETLAEAAHAGAGIEWSDPARHLLIHE